MNKRPQSFLPKYITKKIPLLQPPQSSLIERKRVLRAGVITSALVGLPLATVAMTTPNWGEFFEVVTILPLLPIFVIIEGMNLLVPLVGKIYPFVVIVSITTLVFTLVY